MAVAVIMKLRLDKYLTEMGCGTRSQVKKEILKGSVSVNGEIAKKAERKVDTEKDEIIFKGEKISSSAKYVTFTDGTLNISDKNITSLEGLEYFSNIRKLICNNNDISEIPAEVLSRLSELTSSSKVLR